MVNIQPHIHFWIYESLGWIFNLVSTFGYRKVYGGYSTMYPLLYAIFWYDSWSALLLIMFECKLFMLGLTFTHCFKLAHILLTYLALKQCLFLFNWCNAVVSHTLGPKMGGFEHISTCCWIHSMLSSIVCLVGFHTCPPLFS